LDQTDPARDLDPLRHLAEAALARQETAQRQRADDQAAVDRDQADQAETADHTQTLAEAQQLAGQVFGAQGAELAAALTWTAVGSGQATATIDEHVLVYHRTPILWTEPVPPTARSGGLGGQPATGPAHPSPEGSGPAWACCCAVAAGNSSEMPPSPAWPRPARSCAARPRTPAAAGIPGIPTTPSGAHERNDHGIQQLSPAVMVASVNGG
jgi:hypothetical protein